MSIGPLFDRVDQGGSPAGWERSRFRLGSALLVLLLGIGSCAPRPGSVYIDQNALTDPARTDWQDIGVYFSSLDSIRPYVHVFPTGNKTEAPNLDPRSFFEPAGLAGVFNRLSQDTVPGMDSIGHPNRAYEVIGEVKTELLAKFGGELTCEPDPATWAPNGKPYFRLTREPDWKRAFETLRRQAAGMGADALIEIFCGQGVDSYWYPADGGRMRRFEPNTEIIGNLSGGAAPVAIEESPEIWTVMGQAIRWKAPVGSTP